MFDHLYVESKKYDINEITYKTNRHQKQTNDYQSDSGGRGAGGYKLGVWD